jgi:hypothetical protein
LLRSQQLSIICPNTRRSISSSPLLFKKKAPKQHAVAEASTEVEDPFDFSTLETGIKGVHEKLDRELQKLRTGGRFNPEGVEGVRVHLVKDSKASIRLGELAQVLPKGGRSIMVLVGEADVRHSASSSHFGIELIYDPRSMSSLSYPPFKDLQSSISSHKSMLTTHHN